MKDNITDFSSSKDRNIVRAFRVIGLSYKIISRGVLLTYAPITFNRFYDLGARENNRMDIFQDVLRVWQVHVMLQLLFTTIVVLDH